MQERRDRLTPLLGALTAGALAAAVARLLAQRGAGSAPAAQEQPEPEQPPPPLPGRPRLVGVVGGSVEHGQVDTPPEVELTPGRTVIGRDREADVRLDDPTVSPRHALLDTEPDGRTWVRDLGALNGLLVDGVPVAEVELHDGNRLTLGQAHLVFRVDPREDRGGREGGELGEKIARPAQGQQPAENRSDP